MPLFFPQSHISPDPLPNPPETVTVDKWYAEAWHHPASQPPLPVFVIPPWIDTQTAPADTNTVDKWRPHFHFPIEFPEKPKAKPWYFPHVRDLLPGFSIAPAAITGQSQFGTPTILIELVAGQLIQVFIDGVDQTSKVMVFDSPVTVNKQIGSPDTATFRVFTRPGTYRPEPDQEVVIYKGTSRIFGGHIENVVEEWYNGGNNAMAVTVQCNGYASMLARRIVSRYWDNVFSTTAAGLIATILREELGDTGIRWAFGDSAVIDTEKVFSHVPMTDVLNELVNQNGRDWKVDAYKRLYIFDKTSGYGAAPFAITDNDGRLDEIRVEKARGQRATRVGVRNNQREPATWTDTFRGDGVTRFFITRYQLPAEPIITVNGVQVTVLEGGAYTLEPHEFSYGTGAWGVFSNPYNPPYSTSDVIEVTYPGKLQPITWAEDTAAIVAGDIWEHVEDVHENLDPDAQQDLADGILARRKNIPYIVDFKTRQDGLEPGQVITINTTKPLVPNLTLLIDSVSMTEDSKLFFRYQVKATNEQIQGGGNYVRALEKLVRHTRQPQDRITYKIVIKLAQTLGMVGDANSGLTVGVVPGSRVAEKTGYLRDITWRWDTQEPVNTDVTVNIKRNGTSIFPVANVIKYRKNQNGTLKFFRFSTWPYLVTEGDVFTAEVLTADPLAKDGTIELTIQG